MPNLQTVTPGEMYTFLAITMGQYFTRNPYQNIMCYMHFENNEGNCGNDRLKKIQPIDNFRWNMVNCVNPRQNLCLDESLML
jgi:hypothetical protein